MINVTVFASIQILARRLGLQLKKVGLSDLKLLLSRPIVLTTMEGLPKAVMMVSL